MRNIIFTIFSQQILNGRLLLVVKDRQKSNLSFGFKLQPIKTNQLWFVVKNKKLSKKLITFFSHKFF